MTLRRFSGLLLLAGLLVLPAWAGGERPPLPAQAPPAAGQETGEVADSAATEPGSAPDGTSEAAAGPEGDAEGVSTIDLLNEDERIEEGAGTDAAAGVGAPGDEVLGDEAVDDKATPAPVRPTEELAGLSEDAVELFPSSPGIEQQKAFWIEIFTHYNSHQGVLHDRRIALPVYEALDLTGLPYREQLKRIRLRRNSLAADLRGLAQAVASGAPLEAGQQALLDKLPEGATPAEMRDFAENLRFQRGLADRFREGLIRAAALAEHIRPILARHGVPEDLAYLPHVESSYQNRTFSKAGAAGIWQFTRGTGRMFMTLRYEVDERMDPVIATEAAARFLRQNYDRLGTWPLAITAYNHGPQSLQRITERMDTRDLGVLIQEYDGRLFKFASKNFYASFLAAREVAQDHERYFGPLELLPTLEFAEVELPWYTDPELAAKTLEVSLETLQRLNPAVRPPVWQGSKHIPPGYALRIPVGYDPQRFLAAFPKDARHAEQKRTLYVRVTRGDTLYDIGRRYGLSWRAIAQANDISSVHRLRPGQRLILPWDGPTPPQALAAAVEQQAQPATATPRPEHVLERMPATPQTAPWTGGQPATLADGLHSEGFQELRVVRFDAERKEAEIVAAYGETAGIYADWAGVTAVEVRRLNDLYARSVLRPGEAYLVPLDAVPTQQFEQRRIAFHREREEAFFAANEITEKVKVEAQRGQSPWRLAQSNNVPMWLFYKENPHLLTQPLQAGMEVILPIVRPGGTVSR